MTRLTIFEFTKLLCEDHGIEFRYEKRLDLPATKNVLKEFVRRQASLVKIDGTIPYMLNHTVRNEEALSWGTYLTKPTYRSLYEVIKELGLTLKSHSVKICESGGWYSKGYRYFYKDFYCDC